MLECTMCGEELCEGDSPGVCAECEDLYCTECGEELALYEENICHECEYGSAIEEEDIPYDE